ncbi:pyrimidine utilization regulatory protein R [Delftia tsuruhatensis]|uniref:TetR/AcrR family transcriptional regulator n=1 Tax=Delftia tsuruhatensis TaxID=180282 RepID=UPI001E6A5844|nr:TetR/AcrR family transcriptional regulator [Delftia tsuruhatensis]CAB5668747.1 pyrimidine utilization regulatory protein R [Delftia tsuruhatensis]CAC9682652.1 pyrimidine utilization regulatory protein R [Delftia tsuruhatensis]
MTSKRPSADIRRAQLLDAADAVFSEHGVTAPLDLVVERAEVGRATLYRQFPDRRALMLALLERSLDNMRIAAEAMAEDDDAFYKLLSRLAERIAVSAPITDYWRTVERGDEVIAQARVSMWQIFRPAMDRAVACGQCRQPLTQSELSLVFGMLGASLRGETPQQRRSLARKALQIVWQGLKA